MDESSESPAGAVMTEHGSSPASMDRSDKRRKTNTGEGRKRDHYVSRACEACKRRKQRCDGMVPCRRCHRAGVDCVYLKPIVTSRKRSQREEPRPWDPEVRSGGDIHHLTNLLSSMQKKINSLSSQLKQAELSSQESQESAQSSRQSAPSLSRSITEPHFDRSRLRQRGSPLSAPDPSTRKQLLPDYHGPTSSRFPLGMARNLLQQMADPDGVGDVNGSDIPYLTPNIVSPEDNPYIYTRPRFMDSLAILESIGWDEATRLLGVYEECLGVLHPLLDLHQLHQHISVIFTKIYGGTRAEDDYGVDQDDVNNLKLVLAVALLAEGAGESALAAALYASLWDDLQLKILGNKIDMKGQILLCLAGIYHFFQDQARIASRMVAIAARMTLESGLQNREVLFHTFPDKEMRTKALIVLWSIFILDRQFSFAAGLPQTMQDSDMDVPAAETAPYLLAMSSYVKFGSKAWDATCDRHGRMKASCSSDTLDFIEYQVQQWQKSLPVELQPDALLFEYSPTGLKASPAIRCMRTLLFLRANQIRLLVMRGILFSPALATVHKSRVVSLLERAKETIRVLVRLDTSGDIYRTHQILFNHFLASALSALCLFLAHEPRQRNSKNSPFQTTDFLSARDGIALAFDLVRKYSSSSGSSRRLWRTFSGLKELLARLGFLRHEEGRPTPTGISRVNLDDNPKGPPGNITSQAAPTSGVPPAEETQSLEPDITGGMQEQYDLTEFFSLLGTDPLQTDANGLIPFPEGYFGSTDPTADTDEVFWSTLGVPSAAGYADSFDVAGDGGNIAVNRNGPPEFSWMFHDML